MMLESSNRLFCQLGPWVPRVSISWWRDRSLRLQKPGSIANRDTSWIFLEPRSKAVSLSFKIVFRLPLNFKRFSFRKHWYGDGGVVDFMELSHDLARIIQSENWHNRNIRNRHKNLQSAIFFAVCWQGTSQLEALVLAVYAAGAIGSQRSHGVPSPTVQLAGIGLYGVIAENHPANHIWMVFPSYISHVYNCRL